MYCLISAYLVPLCLKLLAPCCFHYLIILQKFPPSAVLIVCYLISLDFLTFAIKTIPIAIVYATWAGWGVFLVAFLGYVFFVQALQWQAIAGLFFIVVGVTLVISFSTAH